MIRIGIDRIGSSEQQRNRQHTASDICPVDGERAVFQRTALVCPRCGRVLGGI